MSEYQYYEWQSVDQLLTEAEQEAVDKLSSHIEVSSSRAVVTYAWGDFKHDPRQVLSRFFDAHLYLANWGSRRLMFRFPSGLINREAIEQYCVPEQITFGRVNKFDVLDIDLSEEDGGDWIEGEGSLSGLISLRRDLIQGDYRCLYLAWLKAMSLQNGSCSKARKSCGPKPSIPAGLQQLSPTLKRFVEQFDVPTGLVEAAAEHSHDWEEPAETDFHPLVAQLTREECDEFLCRFAQGDAIAAGVELKRRLLSLVPCSPNVPGERCAFDALVERAEVLETKREERQKQETRKKHEAEMTALAEREAETWRQVEALVGLKKTNSYDEAVQLLTKLAQLAEFRGSQVAYRQRMNALCDQYKRLSGFQWRVQEAKLVR